MSASRCLQSVNLHNFTHSYRRCRDGCVERAGFCEVENGILCARTESKDVIAILQ